MNQACQGRWNVKSTAIISHVSRVREKEHLETSHLLLYKMLQRNAHEIALEHMFHKLGLVRSAVAVAPVSVINAYLREAELRRVHRASKLTSRFCECICRL